MSIYTIYTCDPTATTADNTAPEVGVLPNLYLQNDAYITFAANAFYQPLQTLGNNVGFLLDGYGSYNGLRSFKAIDIDGIGGQVVSPAAGSLSVSGVATFSQRFVANSGTFLASASGGGSALSGNITDSVTTIPIYSTLNFFTNGEILIGTEKISYTGISGNNLLNCIRGDDATTPASHSTNDIVQSYFAGWTSLCPNTTPYTLYNSNVTFASGSISTAGVITSGFGIISISSGGTGIYDFTTTNSDSSAARLQFSVTLRSAAGMVTANQTSTNQFAIHTYDTSGSPVSGVSFYFSVVLS